MDRAASVFLRDARQHEHTVEHEPVWPESKLSDVDMLDVSRNKLNRVCGTRMGKDMFGGARLLRDRRKTTQWDLLRAHGL